MIRGFALATLALVVGGIAWFGPEALLTARIGTGYVARQMCSCIFVARRDADACRQDMIPQMDAIDVEVLPDGVRASLPLLPVRTARHRPGLGCTLWE